jgi:hypothetical protein
MEPADLVGPPGHRDSPPFGEQGGMVTLLLGEGTNPIGEGQRVGEAREVEGALEPGDAVPLTSCRRGPCASAQRSASVTRGGRGDRQRSVLHSVFIGRTSERLHSAPGCHGPAGCAAAGHYAPAKPATS